MSRLARFSLSSSPDAPTVTLPHTGQTLNGAAIVLATADDLNRHIRDLMASDTDGTWSDLTVYADPETDRLMAHDCRSCDMPDHDYGDDVTIALDSTGGVFAVVWIDLREVPVECRRCGANLTADGRDIDGDTGTVCPSAPRPNYGPHIPLSQKD